MAQLDPAIVEPLLVLLREYESEDWAGVTDTFRDFKEDNWGNSYRDVRSDTYWKAREYRDRALLNRRLRFTIKYGNRCAYCGGQAVDPELKYELGWHGTEEVIITTLGCRDEDACYERAYPRTGEEANEPS